MPFFPVFMQHYSNLCCVYKWRYVLYEFTVPKDYVIRSLSFWQSSAAGDLDHGTCLWKFVDCQSGRYLFSFDVHGTFLPCIDRRSAGFCRVTFPVFRFCGVYWQTRIAVSCLLLQSFSVFSWFRGLPSCIRFRGMVGRITPALFRYLLSAGTVLVLAAAVIWIHDWIPKGHRALCSGCRFYRQRRYLCGFAVSGDADR